MYHFPEGLIRYIVRANVAEKNHIIICARKTVKRAWITWHTLHSILTPILQHIAVSANKIQAIQWVPVNVQRNSRSYDRLPNGLKKQLNASNLKNDERNVFEVRRFCKCNYIPNVRSVNLKRFETHFLPAIYCVQKWRKIQRQVCLVSVLINKVLAGYNCSYLTLFLKSFALSW